MIGSIEQPMGTEYPAPKFEGSKMDINSLTIGQAKELAAMFAMANPSSGAFTPHIGKICVVRTYASGVFMGTVTKQDGRMVEMTNARRLWSWKATEGISLSAVAVDGVDPRASKFPQVTPEHTLLDALEIIPASDKCITSVNATPVARQS